jgi:hypothetical protein
MVRLRRSPSSPLIVAAIATCNVELPTNVAVATATEVAPMSVCTTAESTKY